MTLAAAQPANEIVVAQVEDERDFAGLTADWLRPAGFVRHTRHDGIGDGVRRLLATAAERRVLIVDLKLGRKHDLFETVVDLVRRREALERRGIEIIVVSGHLGKDVVGILTAAGFSQKQLFHKDGFPDASGRLVASVRGIKGAQPRHIVAGDSSSRQAEIRLHARMCSWHPGARAVEFIEPGQHYRLEIGMTIEGRIDSAGLEELGRRNITFLGLGEGVLFDPDEMSVSVHSALLGDPVELAVQTATDLSSFPTILVAAFSENHCIAVLSLSNPIGGLDGRNG